MSTFENKENISVNDLLSTLSQNVDFNLQWNQELYTKIDDINNNPDFLSKFTSIFDQAAQNVWLLNQQEIQTV